MAKKFFEAKIKMPKDSGADLDILQVRILLVAKEGITQTDPKANAQALARYLKFVDREVLQELPWALLEMLAKRQPPTSPLA